MFGCSSFLPPFPNNSNNLVLKQQDSRSLFLLHIFESALLGNSTRPHWSTSVTDRHLANFNLESLTLKSRFEASKMKGITLTTPVAALAALPVISASPLIAGRDAAASLKQNPAVGPLTQQAAFPSQGPDIGPVARDEAASSSQNPAIGPLSQPCPEEKTSKGKHPTLHPSSSSHHTRTVTSTRQGTITETVKPKSTTKQATSETRASSTFTPSRPGFPSSSTKTIASPTSKAAGATATWNTLPISPVMLDCYNSQDCQDAKFFYNYCVNTPPMQGNDTATWTCFCHDHNIGRLTWKSSVEACAACMQKNLPPGNPTPAADLSINVVASLDGYCNMTFHAGNTALLNKLGLAITSYLWLPISLFDITILQAPVSLPGEMKRDTPTWATFPVTAGMEACANSIWCEWAAQLWNDCTTQPGAKDCLCTGDNYNHWKIELNACAQCIDSQLPRPSPDQLGTLGSSADSQGWVPYVAEEYCRSTDTDAEFLAGLEAAGRQITIDFESPILIYNMTLMSAPPQRRMIDSILDSRHEVASRDIVPGGLPNSWVGPPNPGVTACYYNANCTKARNIFAECMSCASPADNWLCLCAPEGTKIDGGVPTLGGGLFGPWWQAAVGCWQCVTNNQHGLDDIESTIQTYCFDEPYTRESRSRTRMLWIAQDLTYAEKSPIELLNFTVTVKAPEPIPSSGIPYTAADNVVWP
ncbi:hypothetical protein G7Y89_g15495 [Cudoniella acicularis]|uniref:Uncharacterized protein n=1 Tax=Cudoniella acicularis TaxID=354080 RepID=A0A8H4VKX6_9HELO|nr:hypothetical protein G7Y89_g15495 [Cudoniella acicularis]